MKTLKHWFKYEGKLLTLKTAANYLGISVEVLSELIRFGFSDEYITELCRERREREQPSPKQEE